MATRDWHSPARHATLFEVAYHDRLKDVWVPIAWAAARIWADDIAKAYYTDRACAVTVEVWQSTASGKPCPVAHWEPPVPVEPEITTIVAR